MADNKLSYNNMIHLLTIKLDATNYMMWRKQVQHLLRSQKLLGHIDGSTPCPRVPPPPSFAQAAGGSSTPAGTSKAVYEERKAAFDQWVADDEKLCCLLLSSVSVEVMSEISSCDTAAQIWSTLTSVFHNRSKSSVLSLRVQIMNLRKNGSVHELHLQFKALFDRLAAMDSPASKDDMVLWFLHALGAEFRDFSAPLLSRDPTPAYIDVVAEAENQEAFLRNLQGFGGPAPAPCTFLAETRSGRTGGGAWGRRVGPMRRQIWPRRRPWSVRRPIWWFCCSGWCWSVQICYGVPFLP